MNKLFRSISEYDESNNLIRYYEMTDDLKSVKCSYEVAGKTLKRTYLQSYTEDSEFFQDIMKSVVEYSENIMLFSLRMGGETYMQPILSGDTFTSLVTPNIVNSIFTCQGDCDDSASVETFSLDSDLINSYLSML